MHNVNDSHIQSTNIQTPKFDTSEADQFSTQVSSILKLPPEPSPIKELNQMEIKQIDINASTLNSVLSDILEIKDPQIQQNLLTRYNVQQKKFANNKFEPVKAQNPTLRSQVLVPMSASSDTGILGKVGSLSYQKTVNQADSKVGSKPKSIKQLCKLACQIFRGVLKNSSDKLKTSESNQQGSLTGTQEKIKSSRSVKKIFIKNQVTQLKSELEKKTNTDLTEKEMSSISEKGLKKLVKQGEKLETGDSRLTTISGRSVLITKTLHPETKEVAIAIHIIAKQHFAKGGIGEIRGALTLGSGVSIIEKRALLDHEGNIDASKKADVENEIRVLRDLGIMHSVIQENGQTAGFIMERYDGDGDKALELMNQSQSPITTTPKELVQNLNQEITKMFQKGYYHFDHKLGNTLFKQHGAALNLVLCDFGGDVKKTEFSNQLQAYLNMPEGTKEERDIKKKALSKLYGQNTPGTSCWKDWSAFTELLKLPGVNTPQQVTNLMEKRMVFSHAIVIMAILTGKPDLDASQFEKIKDVSELKALLSKSGLKDDITDSQLEILFKAISMDHTKRPSLQELTRAWE